MSPKSPAWLTQLSYPVHSILYPDLCIACDCFMILMLRSFQFSALSRGSQRPNLPYKRALRDILGGIHSTSVFTGNSVTLLTTTGIISSKHRHFCNNTSLSSKPKSYLLIFVCCCGREFQFLSFPTHSGLTFRSTLPTFYVPNPLSPLGCNKTLVGEWRNFIL